jgi:hypothetical protein
MMQFVDCIIPGKIWNVCMVEDSDIAWIQYEKDGKFYLSSIQFSEKKIQPGIPLPEERLVMHSASQHCVVFRRFPRRDWPVAVGILGWQVSANRYWISEKASPIKNYDDQHWVVQYEGEGLLLMNVLDGKTYELKEFKEAETPVLRYSEDSSYYSDLKKFVGDQLSVSVKGVMEYCESGGCFGMAFHTEEKDKTINTTTVFWDQDGNLLHRELCFGALQGMVDTLMIANKKWLLYLKSETEFVFVSWKQ